MQRITYLAALVATLTLVPTTGAIGADHPDDRSMHGPGAVALEQQSGVVRPDDRETHGPGAAVAWSTGDTARPDDRATHGQGAVAIEQRPGSGQVPIIAPAASGADGFDWLDAAIGAAAAFGLGLIVAGGVALVLRRAHAPAYS